MGLFGAEVRRTDVGEGFAAEVRGDGAGLEGLGLLLGEGAGFAGAEGFLGGGLTIATSVTTTTSITVLCGGGCGTAVGLIAPLITLGG